MGRPIFFSVLITILSFLPVFALLGREGKLFHPLAYTKTFALVGVALLSITLVPALIPIFLRGRIKSEEENWLVRTMIEIFKPMLSWLMDRTTLVCWLFVIILGLGYLASHEARPRVHARPRRAEPDGHADDRPPGLDRRGDPRTFESVTRSSGASRRSGRSSARRAAPRRRPTPRRSTWSRRSSTSATTMSWPKRKLQFEDATAQTKAALDALVAKGLIRRRPRATIGTGS